MRRTIELSETGEESLRRMAQSVGHSEDAMLRAITELLLVNGATAEGDARHDFVLTIGDRKVFIDLKDDIYPVRSTEGVMGGDACIRNSRIPVWMLVGYKQAGFADERILRNFPSLSAADLAAAWDFYAANSERVIAERRRHEEAD
ncbi:hypothetical protein BH11ARM2_BH11ARM2_13570 [soil metagenome]